MVVTEVASCSGGILYDGDITRPGLAGGMFESR